jgi:ABC-type phosphate transport system substrate-binding protein
MVALGTGAVMLSTTALAGTAAAAPAGTTNYKVNVVGSDTIYCVDGGSTGTGLTTTAGIMSRYTSAVKGTSGNQVFVGAPWGGINFGCRTTPTTATVPSDSVHGLLKYANGNPAPEVGFPTGAGKACANPLKPTLNSGTFDFGSSAGISCYVDDQGAGDITFTRSSRGRKSSDPANLEFWAFALDAVTWTHMSANTHAPKSMTPAQLTAIYNCTDTTWGQVNGNPSDTTPITKYYPQVGSGTGDFFATVFLGGARPAPGGNACDNTITFVAENDATQIKSADQASAILPYSFAVRAAQASTKKVEHNLGAGTVLGEVNGAVPSVTTIKETTAKTNISGNQCLAAPSPGTFCGARYVYHTVWSKANVGGVGLTASVYAAAIDIMGVPSSGTAGANSICANKYSTVIRTYGFVPLSKATTSQGNPNVTPVPGTSYCREF